MEDYAGKTVVITGGTSGLGFALAKILGGRGASIVITGRREEKGAEAVEKLATFAKTSAAKATGTILPSP